MPTDKDISLKTLKELGQINIENIIETQEIMKRLAPEQELFNHFVFMIAMLNHYIENDENF